MEEKTAASLTDEIKGTFIESLVRSNTKIKRDRALAIYEDAEMEYKRKVEDMNRAIVRMKRDRINMLDLAPDTIGQLKPAKDIDPVKFVTDDIEYLKAIRNEIIVYNLAVVSYNQLFGKDMPKMNEEAL